MPLSDQDRRLIQGCLAREPAAWADFVDRFAGLVFRVIQHTCHLRQNALQSAEIEDLAAEVMAQLVAHDFRSLRRFRGKSSLETYLAVIARRVVDRQLLRRSQHARLEATSVPQPISSETSPELRIETQEEVQRLLNQLDGPDAQLVRSFYLEHKSYRQISQDLGIPRNSIGPQLARLRARLRNASSN